MKISVDDAHEFFLDDVGYLCDVGYGFDSPETHPLFDQSNDLQIIVLLPPKRLLKLSSKYPRIKASLESQRMVFLSEEEYWIDWESGEDFVRRVTPERSTSYGD